MDKWSGLARYSSQADLSELFSRPPPPLTWELCSYISNIRLSALNVLMVYTSDSFELLGKSLATAALLSIVFSEPTLSLLETVLGKYFCAFLWISL